jgi:hypothetical protein
MRRIEKPDLDRISLMYYHGCMRRRSIGSERLDKKRKNICENTFVT